MTNPYLKTYMAKQLMQLRSATGLQAFVTTVWAGTPIMVTWNIPASEIMSIWNDGIVDDSDIPFLSEIIKDFLKGEIRI